MTDFTNSSIIKRAAEIQQINAIISAYHPNDPGDGFIDDRVDAIRGKLMEIAATPVRNAAEAVAVIDQLINYIEPGDEYDEDKITAGILHGVRKYLAGQ